MRKPVSRALLAAAIVAGFAPAADGVYLNPDGLGQALIYPYYTARSAGGNAFNTYISVINHSTEAKVVRVRFREALDGKVVQGFNVYLSPLDMWTGTIAPLGAPEGATRIVTADTSCVNGPFDTSEPGLPGRTFQNAFYAGANSDGLGAGLDRAREGWVEMIEMATLTGASAAAVAHSGGAPVNCAAVLGDPALSLAAPGGELSGTLTLINVMSGQDFTVNAEALAELSTQPFYRAPADPYPGFDAAEITPVSTLTANGNMYRSVWSRGVDAVSASLMRSEAAGEYVLDLPTRSRTDIVMTFPTRHHYGSRSNVTPPFNRFEDVYRAAFFNRDERGVPALADCADFQLPPTGCVSYRYRGPVSVATLSNGAAHTLPADGIFGSQARPASTGTPLALPQTALFANGWARLQLDITPLNRLTSLPSSTRQDLATGQVTTGAHVYNGMPVVGFTARTFENGALPCGPERCQGNYGGAFPMKFRRSVTTP